MFESASMGVCVVSVMNILSSRTRSNASRKERRNMKKPQNPEMGNVTHEITQLPEEIDLGEFFLAGNLRPLGSPPQHQQFALRRSPWKTEARSDQW